MGASLDPNNPLYAGASAQVEAYAASSLGQPTQPLEDLDPEALLENPLSEDMLDSISIIDTASALSDDPLGNAEKAKQVSDDHAGISLEQGLDFDLDISEKTEEQEDFPLTLPEIDAVSSLKPVPEEEPMPVIDFGSIDFDLGSDDDKEDSATVSLVNGDAADVSAKQTEVAAPAMSIESKDNDIDFGSLDFVMSDDDIAPVKDEPLLASDELELNFGLDSDANVASVADLESPVEDISPYNAEMATKLDLAVAYKEIGDKEGARELLDEVIKGGSSEQIEKARKMLEQLS
jgi:pilus assembly protein FimV